MSVSAAGPAATSAMKDEEELLVRCIAIRAAYGGMAGDVTMLREFAAVWSTRSAIPPLPNLMSKQPVQHMPADMPMTCCCTAVTWLAAAWCAHMHAKIISFADTPTAWSRSLAEQQCLANASGPHTWQYSLASTL